MIRFPGAKNRSRFWAAIQSLMFLPRWPGENFASLMSPHHARKFIDFGAGRGMQLAVLRARAIREGILPRAVFTGEE